MSVEYTSAVRLSALNCPVKSVSVFNDRAEVNRLVSCMAAAGPFSLVVSGLTDQVLLNSIHVSGGIGDATILEVSTQSIYDHKGADTSQNGLIQKEIQEVDELKESLKEELHRIAKEKAWLDSWADNMKKPFGGAFGTTDPTKTPAFDPLSWENLEKTEKFIDFYGTVMTKLDNKISKAGKEMKELEQRRQILEKKIITDSVSVTETREVTISLEVAKPGEISLNLSYVAMGASWHASYDVRVATETGRSQLTYYGIVANRTKENWIETSISLSTASPSLGGSPPELKTLQVSWVPVIDHSLRSFNSSSGGSGGSLMSVQNAVWSVAPVSRSSASGGGSAPPPTVKALVAQSQDAMSSSSFSIPRAATIHCDAKPHKVTIAVLDLESRFTYTLVPKLTTHAYLKATTTNDSTLPFLQGPANIFMDSNFVANSTLKNVSPGEKFALFLGTDRAVTVDYKPERRLNETQGYLAKSAIQTIKQEVVVKNTKNVQIAIVLYQQLPLSSDEKIKIRLVAPVLTTDKQDPKDKHNIKLNSSNNIEWRQMIDAKQEVKFAFEHVVEWPKDKQISYDNI